MTDFDHSRPRRDELLLEPGWVLLPDGAARHHAVLVRHGVFAGGRPERDREEPPPGPHPG